MGGSRQRRSRQSLPEDLGARHSPLTDLLWSTDSRSTGSCALCDDAGRPGLGPISLGPYLRACCPRLTVHGCPGPRWRHPPPRESVMAVIELRTPATDTLVRDPAGCRALPVMRQPACSAPAKHRGRTERQTRHCEAHGALMRADTTRTRTWPWLVGSAPATTLAPVVDSTHWRQRCTRNRRPAASPRRCDGVAARRGPSTPRSNGPLAVVRGVHPATHRARRLQPFREQQRGRSSR